MFLRGATLLHLSLSTGLKACSPVSHRYPKEREEILYSLTLGPHGTTELTLTEIFQV